jgi:hypothetical protein
MMPNDAMHLPRAPRVCILRMIDGLGSRGQVIAGVRQAEILLDLQWLHHFQGNL